VLADPQKVRFMVDEVPGIRGLQSSALIFLVPLDDISATNRAGNVLLALKIAVDAVPPDLDAPGVLERLEIAADRVAVSDDQRIILIVKDIAVDRGAQDTSGFALYHLHAAANARCPAYRDAPGVLGLDVANYGDIDCEQSGVRLHFDCAFHLRSLERAARAVRDAQVVHGDRAEGTAADALIRLSGYGDKADGARNDHDQEGYPLRHQRLLPRPRHWTSGSLPPSISDQSGCDTAIAAAGGILYSGTMVDPYSAPRSCRGLMALQRVR
jgi:hypothetical protein